MSIVKSLLLSVIPSPHSVKIIRPRIELETSMSMVKTLLIAFISSLHRLKIIRPDVEMEPFKLILSAQSRVLPTNDVVNFKEPDPPEEIEDLDTLETTTIKELIAANPFTVSLQFDLIFDFCKTSQSH